MTLSQLDAHVLRIARDSDPLTRILMAHEGVEIEQVEGHPGYFICPLNGDHLVKGITVGEKWELSVKGIGRYPSSYYVCDSPEQFIEKYGELLERDERRFIVFFTPMVKSEQSPTGGWRWHKWGEYVGEGTPTTEYLYDEPEFERVYTVSIVHVDY